MPSVASLRRLFLPYSRNATSSKKYRGLLKARLAPKSNTAPAGNKVPEHRHEAFSTMKHVNEWTGLHSEITVFSVDNKAQVAKYVDAFVI